jgi:hypothetical protein
MVWECSIGAGGPFIGPGKVGNDRRQCLGLKAPITGVFKSRGSTI